MNYLLYQLLKILSTLPAASPRRNSPRASLFRHESRAWKTRAWRRDRSRSPFESPPSVSALRENRPRSRRDLAAVSSMGSPKSAESAQRPTTP